MKTHATTLVIAAALLLAGPLRADEGMYPLADAGGWPVKEMKAAGLSIAPEELLALRRAVVQVARGGTGSFVSPRGLLVTNHHVAYRCIAALDGMPAHEGIMEKGHVAGSAAEEIPCPGYDLQVVEDVRDITAEVKGAVKKGMKGHRRFEAIRKAKEELEEECQREPGLTCEADSLDGGRFYHMMVYRRVRDVRLVYAPEADIGKFGGDVDNWMYPRHTGDFTFLRAYVNDDGKGAPFHQDNVPFEPAAHLSVSGDGVARGDIVLVMGFPARTKRNYPSASARYSVETDMPVRSRVYSGMIEVIEKVGAADDLSRRRYQALHAGLNNAVKYYAQSTEGFEKWQVVAKRVAREQAVKERLGGDRAAARRFEKVVRDIDRAYARYGKAHARHFFLQRFPWMVASVGTAFHIARWTDERRKPDAERKDAEYKSKNVYRVFDGSDRLDDRITLVAERALLTYLLREEEKLPAKERLRAVKKLLAWGRKEANAVKREARKAKEDHAELYREITGTDPSDDPVVTAVDLLYGRTALLARGADSDELDRALFARRRLFYNDARDAARFKDPLLEFARNLAREKLALEKGPYRAIEETFDTELRPEYAELIGATYPDANFQVRLTHGKVDDYTATKDGKKHRYVTDLAGVLAKDKGEYPFRVPEKLEQAAAGDKGRFVDQGIGDVPVNFTSTLDTTGGNSGSPVLDGKGRLVGLLFDGTPESILSDWQFLPDDQRSICVDIRYALFLAEKVHGAKALLKELGF
jgi:hypothetical protein